MIKIMGFTIETRQEQRKREEEALYHYFRYGAKHRNQVGKLLEELIPGEKREHLLMYYLQLKDGMEKCGTQDFEEALKQVNPKLTIIKVNKMVNRYFKAVMEADAEIKEDLVLPSAKEIRRIVDEI